MQAALVRLLAWRLDLAHVDPLSTVDYRSGGNPKFKAGKVVTLRAISGHRDTGPTECPGDRRLRAAAVDRAARRGDGPAEALRPRRERSRRRPRPLHGAALVVAPLDGDRHQLARADRRAAHRCLRRRRLDVGLDAGSARDPSASRCAGRSTPAAPCCPPRARSGEARRRRARATAGQAAGRARAAAAKPPASCPAAAGQPPVVPAPRPVKPPAVTTPTPVPTPAPAPAPARRRPPRPQPADRPGGGPAVLTPAAENAGTRSPSRSPWASRPS